MAVNCLDTDAMSNRVAVVRGVPASLSASPDAPAHTTEPSSATAAEHPGSDADTSRVIISSLRSDFSTSSARSADAGSGVSLVARTGSTGRRTITVATISATASATAPTMTRRVRRVITAPP